MPTELVTSCLFKIKVFWNEGYDNVISVSGVTKKIFSRASNYVVDLVIWPKFVNSNISMREVVSTRKTNFLLSGLGSCSILGQVLSMALGFYGSVAKGLKLKVRTFWGMILLEKLQGKIYPTFWIPFFCYCNCLLSKIPQIFLVSTLVNLIMIFVVDFCRHFIRNCFKLVIPFNHLK